MRPLNESFTILFLITAFNFPHSFIHSQHNLHSFLEGKTAEKYEKEIRNYQHIEERTEANR
jgi:hypothetical protein